MKLYSFEEFLNESKTKDGMWNVKLPSGAEIALPKSFTVSKTMPYSDFKLYKGTYKLKIAATKNKYVYYNQAFKSEVTLDDTDIINFDRIGAQITLHESQTQLDFGGNEISDILDKFLDVDFTRKGTKFTYKYGTGFLTLDIKNDKIRGAEFSDDRAYDFLKHMEEKGFGPNIYATLTSLAKSEKIKGYNTILMFESVNAGKKYKVSDFKVGDKVIITRHGNRDSGIVKKVTKSPNNLVYVSWNPKRPDDESQAFRADELIPESVNEGKSSTKMFTESDILKHPSYKKSSEMVQSISEDMEGNTFHHHFHITYPLSEMLGEDYKTFAEIGSFCGGSMCLMLQNKKGKSHISIDPFKAKPNQEKMFDNNTSKYIGEGQTLEKFVGLSDAPKIIKESCAAIEKAGGADIFFIDGSHAKHMVEKDFKNYESSVNPGGLIIFDDYMDNKDSPGVKKAVDGMLNDGMFENYNVIGTIKNEAKAYSNGGSSETNNEYIIQKKIKDI